MIELLNFSMPDFDRTTWASQANHHNWQPRLENEIIYNRERLLHAVSTSIIDATLLQLEPYHVPKLLQKIRLLGLKCIASEKKLPPQFKLLNHLQPSKDGSMYLLICRLESINRASSIWADREENELLELLAWPECCREQYQTFLDDDNISDPILNFFNKNVGRDQFLIQSQHDFFKSIILMKYGIRYLPHIPCQHDCKKSEILSNSMMLYDIDNSLLSDILQWPMSWSSLHGIAEIKLPILKRCYSSTATADKFQLEFNGSLYPEDSPTGLQFPFKMSTRKKLHNTKSFQIARQRYIPVKQDFKQ